ncbi:MAG TPA: bifunctional adenosylcobinamide kinase/adenosylcobinamide-phosphate guanylyltransferase [Dehalococcoidia bacterium]|nr:bifunctional adenosylcobinamide kinase/adenosylcobinamide-phosphate guanylyltransferase [Dehalococcoidia bacterium]
MTKELILVLGGARSGKSAFAQRLALRKGEKVLFIATAEAKDGEMRERIRQHRAARPRHWRTLEEPLNLVRALEENAQYGVLLVDCLALWVNNFLLQKDKSLTNAARETAILEATQQLLKSYEMGKATLILVTNEVGMGLVPPYPLGRSFRDILGRVNQLVASRADRVYLVVAGLAIELKSLGAEQVLDEGRLSRKRDINVL